ncbi:MAG: hypothetical protein KC478_16495 [Bacteriovoracaceae bacterium]|nr:hypothetical protein [Bacteriovoracaceae bacterium]
MRKSALKCTFGPLAVFDIYLDVGWIMSKVFAVMDQMAQTPLNINWRYGCNYYA